MHRPRCLCILVISVLFLISISQLSHSQESDLEKANNLSQQVFKLFQQGRYAEAIPIAENVLAIREQVLGPEHPDVAHSLNNLALLYGSLEDYAKAELLQIRALAISVNALGPEHPHVAISLNNLAELYYFLGDYTKAETLYREALAIRVKALGPEHPHVAISLNNLALLHYSLGDYAKAVPLYERALAITVKALGKEHPDVAITLNGLALLHYSLGDYAKAVPLYERALAITEKALGPDHPTIAPILNNLGMLHYSLGDYAKAVPLHRRALAIREQTLGPEHGSVAESLNNLALLHYSLGDYAKAVPLYERALAITVKALGPDHPRVALALNNLAMLYRSLEDYAKAVAIYKESLAITEKALGPDHPQVAIFLSNLGVLYAGLDNFENAHALLKKAHEIDSKLIDQVMGFTSEDQKMKFLSTKKWGLYAFLSLVAQHLPQALSARKDALDVWLKRKGVILQAQRRFQEAVVYSDDPKAIATFQQLSRVRAQLSKLAFAGPGKEGLEAYKKRIAEFEVQKERLEVSLSKLSQAFALKQKIAKADCQKVAKILPKKTVLIDFARVEMFNFKAKGKDRKWSPAHYLAFVLHSGKWDKVGMIDLGDAEKIDKAVASFKEELSNIRDKKGAKAIRSSRKIYNLVFEPLRKELGSVKKTFISPDGNLNLIPFEVLQSPDGRFLIEDYTFNYLAAGRDVLGFGQIKGKGKKALLMGDPDFDMGAEEKDSTLIRLALARIKQKVIAKRSSDMRGLHFTRLPGTREEVEAIQALFGEDKAELYTGKDALEEVLKQRKTPSILHLATHGFFLSDLGAVAPAPDIMGRAIKLFTSKARIKRGKIENPLLRSGIALAGANKALKSEHAKESDGIVTAEKILGLRLRGTDMVVLSACETGVGEVKTGEGVFGLRRAFTQAGAKSLVMSMWAVPDKETKELMIEFYKKIISGKMNKCQALRQAALKEMKIVKQRYGHTNPLFWGAFVFMGEP